MTHPNLDEVHANALLADVLDDGEIVRSNFLPSNLTTYDQLDQWEQLKAELMHQNRFFPKTELDGDRLEGLLENLTLDADDIPQTWHRARIEKDGRRFELEEMGPPPKRNASHGRANPADIPYLYLGSTEKTAISEVRPHPGEIVCVAKFEITRNLKIVDLRDPRTLISPFLLSDESALTLLRGGDIAFLERLGRELTTPVLPTAAAIDYIPSQYFCEFIKRCGYHGVVYESSVSDGMNLALFDPNEAVGGEVMEYSVRSVLVEFGNANGDQLPN